MKVMIVGAAGQVGSDLASAIREHGDEVIALGRTALDVSQPDMVRNIIAAHAPAVVVNCSVYHPVDECELHPDASLTVNALGPLHLARACRDHGAALLHFSSDYVFDGESDRPYLESDPATPRSVFGISKVAGEQFIRANLPQHYIVRTSGLYGLAGSRVKKGNFVETMLRLGREKGKVRVVNDLRMAQTSTHNLARQAVALIHSQHYGTFHAADHGDLSWYEFALMIFRCVGMKVEVTPVPATEMPALAHRPRYSVLANRHLQQVGLDRMQPIEQALQHYLQARQAGAPLAAAGKPQSVSV